MIRKQPFTIRSLVFVVALGIVGILPLPAQDGGLYGGGAPDDAAYVRLIHGAEQTGTITTSIGDTEYGPLSFATVTPYRPVAAGLYPLRISGRGGELVARDGAYFTIAVLSERLAVFEDPELTDPTQAQLFLYNVAGGTPLELSAADGSTTVIGPVGAGEAEEVLVTPVEAEFAVRNDDQVVADLGDPGLERGQSYSVIVLLSSTGPRVVVEQAEVDAE